MARATPLWQRRQLVVSAAMMVVALLGGGLVRGAAGATVFVGPSGNDAAGCGAATSSACATVGYGVSRANAGDTISIAAGTYAVSTAAWSKSVSVVGAGAAASAVTLKCTIAGAVMADLTGATTLSFASVTLTGCAQLFRLTASAAITLSNAAIQGPLSTGIGSCKDQTSVTLQNVAISDNVQQGIQASDDAIVVINTATLSSFTTVGTLLQAAGAGQHTVSGVTLTGSGFFPSPPVIRLSSGSLSLSRSSFNSSLMVTGPLIAVAGPASLLVDSCMFANNNGIDTSPVIGVTLPTDLSAAAQPTSIAVKNSVFIGNRATGGVPGSGGAAISVVNTLSPFIHNAVLTITGSKFSGNQVLADGNAGGYGGALNVQGCTLQITSCRFDKNSAQTSGGAVALNGFIAATISQTTFWGNLAQSYGGAVAILDSMFNNATGRLSTNTVQMNGNQALQGGGAVAVVSAVHNTNGWSWEATSCTFSRNQGGDYGGVFWAFSNCLLSHSNCVYTSNFASRGGVFYISAVSLVKLRHCGAASNSAAYGGVGYGIADSVINATQCTFFQNAAQAEGGVAWLSVRGIFQATNTRVLNNTAMRGGAFYGTGDSWVITNGCSINGNAATYNGGVAYMLGTVTIAGNPWYFAENTTFLSNSADFGGVLYANINSLNNMSVCFFQDNRAKFSGGSMYIAGLSEVNVWDSLIRWGTSGNEGGFIYATNKVLVWLGSSSIAQCSSRRGGAIFGTGFATLTVNRLSFTDNSGTMGGAVHIDGVPFTTYNVKAVLRNCVGTGNSAPNGGVGGFAYVAGLSQLTLQDCTLTANVAAFGGVMYSRGQSKLTVIGGTMQNNYGGVAGVVLADMYSVVSMTQTKLLNNIAGGGGVLYATVQSNVVLTNIIATNNQANGGGALVASESSTVTLKGGVIQGSGAWYGGAVWAKDQATFNCQGATITGNAADNSKRGDGAIPLDAGEGGAVMLDQTASMQSMQCTYSNNRAINGGALFFLQRPKGTCSAVSFQNDKFINNWAAQSGGALQWSFNDDPSTLPCDFCNFYAGYENEADCTFSGNYAPIRPTIGSPFVESISVVVQTDQMWRESSIVSPTLERTRDTNVAEIATETMSFSRMQAECATRNTTYFLRVVGSIAGTVSADDTITGLKVFGLDHYGQVFNGNATATLVASLAAADPQSGESALLGQTVGGSAVGNAAFSKIVVQGQTNNRLAINVSIIEPQGVDTLQMYVYVRACRRGEVQLADNKCYKCPADKYSFNPTDKACTDCPQNVYCAGGDDVTPMNGFWLNPNTPTPVAVQCMFRGACNGTVVSGTVVTKSNTCTEGFQGVLCHECAPGFGRSGQDGCAGCPPKELNILLLTIAAIGAVFVMAIMIFRTRASAGEKSDQLVLMFKVFTSYSQFVSLAAGLDIKWPKSLLDFFGLQSKASSGAGLFVSMDCLSSGSKSDSALSASSFYFQQALYFLSPWIALVFVGMFWGVVFLYRSLFRRAERRSWKSLVRITRDNIIVSMLVILFFLHPNLSQRVLMMFSCRSIGDGSSVLTYDTSITCGGSSYTLFVLAVGIPAFVLYVVGIPLGAFAVMYARREDLHKEWFRSIYGFLYNGYNLNRYYWECVIMLRKVAVISVVVLFSQFGVLVQAGVALGLVYGTFHLHEWAKPYEEAKLSQVERYGLGAAVAIFYIAIFLNVTSPTTEDVSRVPESFNVFLTVVMFAVQIAFFLYFLYHLRHHLVSKVVEAKKTVSGLAKNARRTRRGANNSTRELSETELAEERAYAARMAALEEKYSATGDKGNARQQVLETSRSARSSNSALSILPGGGRPTRAQEMTVLNPVANVV